MISGTFQVYSFAESDSNVFYYRDQYYKSVASFCRISKKDMIKNGIIMC